MIENEVINEYYEWLYYLVCGRRYARSNSFDKLLTYLHETEFTWKMVMDENRADDGINMRYRFALEMGYDDLSDYLQGPCSVLEMMIGLAIRCEESIMDDPELGNRTAQWFWKMITNLGLGGMVDDRFDIQYVSEVVNRFLKRRYKPNGEGGLFIIKYCDYDLRRVEIWHQMCWYLDTIT